MAAILFLLMTIVWVGIGNLGSLVLDDENLEKIFVDLGAIDPETP